MTRSLLQVRGGDAYVIHDLLLDFIRTRIEDYAETKKTAASRQAEYLGRLDVLQTYSARGEVNGGYYSLTSLWRSLEEITGDTDLVLTTYKRRLDEIDQDERGSNTAEIYEDVGILFEIQVRLEVDLSYI